MEPEVGYERRRFSREFKLERVRLIRDRRVSYAQASQGLNIHPTQLPTCRATFGERFVSVEARA